MSTPSTPPEPGPITSPAEPAPLAPPLIAAILLIAAAVLFTGIYLALPQDTHALAFLWIGVLGVLFAVASYLLESVSRRPYLQRSIAWGFYGFGFAILLITLGLNLGGYLSLSGQVVGLVVTLIALAGSIGGISWRYRSVAALLPLQADREAWRNRPAPSALEYSTARSPAAPATAPAPPPSPPPREP